MPLSYRRILTFWIPLAGMWLMMVVQPMVTFFMGQSWYAIQSLAVLPIIYGLTFIFRAIGLSYLEVVIALLGGRREHFGQIRNVGALVALGSAAALVGIAFTPLAFIWFRDISGLTLELTGFALTPIQILAVLPALSVVLALQPGLLVHAHRTRPIT